MVTVKYVETEISQLYANLFYGPRKTRRAACTTNDHRIRIYARRRDKKKIGVSDVPVTDCAYKNCGVGE